MINPAFLTELDRASHPVIKGFICKHIVKVKETGRLLKQQITRADVGSGSSNEWWSLGL